MKFEIEDLIHGRLTPLEFYRKYDRYTRGGIMMDTAPLFLMLIGKLKTNKKERLLREEFGYSIREYDTLNKFLKVSRINTDRIRITPQILFELISHFQKSYGKLKEGKKEVIDEFLEKHLNLLKAAYCDVSTWDILTDKKM